MGAKDGFLGEMCWLAVGLLGSFDGCAMRHEAMAAKRLRKDLGT